jgi:hypothetical protein
MKRLKTNSHLSKLVVFAILCATVAGAALTGGAGKARGFQPISLDLTATDSGLTIRVNRSEVLFDAHRTAPGACEPLSPSG